MSSYYRSSDGLRLAYITHGSGPKVLCLPGLTRNSNDFQYLAKKVKNLTLICPDFRGRGYSEWDTDPDHYTPEYEADDCVALLDYLEIDQIPVIGTSRGGIVACFMPQERVSAIVFNDIGPVIEREGLILINDLIGKNPFAKTHTEMAKLLQGYMVGFDNVPFSRWLNEAKTHFKLAENRLQINYDPKLGVSFKKTFAEDGINFLKQFRSLGTKPVGVVRGVNSNILSAKTVDLMKELYPNLLSKEVPNRGHIPFLDEPESLRIIYDVLTQLKDFHSFNLELDGS